MKYSVATRRAGVVSFLAFILIAGYGGDAKPTYPDGYRNWTHIKSMVIQQGHALYDPFGGIHHIYANSTGLSGYRGAKKKFRDGSVIVFDLLEAPEKDRTITEGPRKLIGVMRKDAKRYRDTGGWGFFAFKGSTKEPLPINPSDCFQCHQAASATDYVFSEYRP
ncbi:MAG: cytochrome P460 family protein [bacterium JZ-2024 1]